MDKTLSIIIPVYNMEDYLNQCLESVTLPEMCKEYEVLIVNDGSNDKSLTIAKEYENMFPEIFSVIDKENGGYGSCFNAGIKKASGKYLRMLDSDDLFEKDEFGRYLKTLIEHDEDLILNAVIELDDISGEKKVSASNLPFQFRGVLEGLDSEDLYAMFIHNCCVKKRLIEDCRCPEHILYTDTVILFHILASFQSAYSSGFVLYCYRINRMGQSAAKDVSLSHYHDYGSVLCGLLDEYPRLDAFQNCKHLVMKKIEMLFYLSISGLLVTQNKDTQYEYRQLIIEMKDYLRKNKIALKELNGVVVRTSLLLGRHGYYILRQLCKNKV